MKGIKEELNQAGYAQVSSEIQAHQLKIKAKWENFDEAIKPENKNEAVSVLEQVA